MTPTEQARRVAEWCGYVPYTGPTTAEELAQCDPMPDFQNSLDACAEFEAEIKRRGWQNNYVAELTEIIGNQFIVGDWEIATATAAQRLAACAATIEQMEGKQDA